MKCDYFNILLSYGFVYPLTYIKGTDKYIAITDDVKRHHILFSHKSISGSGKYKSLNVWNFEYF